MPKDKSRVRAARMSVNRVDPLATSSSSSSSSTAAQKNLPELVRKLSAVSEEEREVACKSLANCLIDEPESALDLMLAHNAIGVLLLRLVDHAPAVATAACGCLRNAVVIGEHHIAAHIVALNGVEPLLAAVPRAYAAALAAASDDVQQRVQLQLLAELLSLVSYLSETSDEVTQQLTRARDFLAGVLSSALMDDADPLCACARAAGVHVAAAQLLYTLVDDNDAFVPVLVGLRPDVAEALHARMAAALTANMHLYATVLAGLLVTAAKRQNAPFAAVLAAVAPVLDAALKIDVVAPFGNIVNAMAQLAGAAGDGDAAEFVSATQSPELRAQVLQWRSEVTCVRTALTLWTDVLGEASESVESAAQLDGALRERAQAWLAPLLLRCVVAPAISDALKACPYLASPLLDLQVENFALLQLLGTRAVNNTLFVLDIDELGREPQRVWDFLARLALKGAAAIVAGDAAAVDDTFTFMDAFSLCESATSALWALLRSERDGQRMPRVAPQAEQLAALRHVLTMDATSAPADLVGDVEAGTFDAAPLASLFTNVVGLLGSLGARAVPDGDHAIATAQALSHLLSTFSSHGALVAEVLNAMFDCFAEDDFNEALKSFRMLESLRAFAPHVQQLVQAAAAADDEPLAERLAETLQNVHAFIEYKSQH
jgi:hypothetical protein